MGLKDVEAFLMSVPDWDFLAPSLGGWAPGDIDGWRERRGHHLYLEVKAPTARLADGQRIGINSRVRDGLSTVIVVWTEVDERGGIDPVRIRVYYPAPYLKMHDHDICNRDTLVDIVQKWYRYANSTLWTDALRQALLAAVPNALAS